MLQIQAISIKNSKQTKNMWLIAYWTCIAADISIRSARTGWIFSRNSVQCLHHQRRLWCMTCLTSLINDLSKAHITSQGKGCETQRDASRERIDSESRTLKLQMVSVTGVIITGNYATPVVLRLHNVWYFNSNFSCTSHHKKSAPNVNGFWNCSEIKQMANICPVGSQALILVKA